MKQDIRIVARPKTKETIYLESKPASVVRCAAVIAEEIEHAIQSESGKSMLMTILQQL